MSEPRRSSRIQLARTPDAPAASGSTTGGQSEHRRRPTKRRREAPAPGAEDTSVVSPPKKRKLKGSLASLPEMPLDVLFEIFHHLSVIDILHISRTTKAFRSVLLNRSARPVWLSALENMPVAQRPPACPSDMSEPAYLSFMLESNCSYCAAGNCQTALVALRKRCCAGCFGSKQNFVPMQSIFSLLGDKFGDVATSLLIPIVIPRGLGQLSKKFKGTYYLADEAKTVISAVRAMYGKRDQWAAFVAPRATALREHNAREEAAQPYIRWLVETRMSHLNDQSRQRDDRKDAILLRLSKLGYEAEADKIRNDWLFGRHAGKHFTQHPFVSTSKPLTERAWQTHEAEMVGVMDTIRQTIAHQRTVARAESRLSDLQRTWWDYRHTAPRHHGTQAPTRGELYEHPRIRAFVNPPPPATPSEPEPDYRRWEPMPTERLQECRALYDAYFAWLPERDSARRRTLASLLPRTRKGKSGGTAGPSADEARLALTTMLFRCTGCPKACGLSGEAAADHQCSWNGPGDDEDFDLSRALRAEPWNHNGRIVFDKEGSGIATMIARVCGLDPATATEADFVSDCDHIVCATCKPTSIWQWRDAIQHGLSKPAHVAAYSKLG